MPASIRCTLLYKKKTTMHYLFQFRHTFAINLNINCYYVIKIIEMIK
jgi:hypothetical protein